MKRIAALICVVATAVAVTAVTSQQVPVPTVTNPLDDFFKEAYPVGSKHKFTYFENPHELFASRELTIRSVPINGWVTVQSGADIFRCNLTQVKYTKQLSGKSEESKP